MINERSHLQNSVVSVELAFHFFSRKICDKIPSYVNLSICFNILLHERENYIALNYPILYAVVLSFSSSGANCHEIGGGIVWGELYDIRVSLSTSFCIDVFIWTGPVLHSARHTSTQAASRSIKQKLRTQHIPLTPFQRGGFVR